MVIRLATAKSIGWGILGPGRIAEKFCADLHLVPDAHVAAVGSRSTERADEFAARHGGTSYGDYAEMVQDPGVDIVYVATPHSLHAEHARLALDAGKAVLCEKPMTMDAASAQELFDHADARGGFLMEAMWMTCHPLVQEVRRLLTDPAHGTPRQVHADLGFVVNPEPTDRLADPELGAGVLLDMGIYPLTFASYFLGEPEELTAVANVSGGVDTNLAIAGRYPGGAMAALTATMTCQSSRMASIATEIGRFDFSRDFHHPAAVTWTSYWEPEGVTKAVTCDRQVIGRGYGNEIVEAQRCLRAGLTESPMVPRAQTLAILRQMDSLRVQLGVS
jgi:predicted dehydrogenase